MQKQICHQDEKNLNVQICQFVLYSLYCLKEKLCLYCTLEVHFFDIYYKNISIYMHVYVQKGKLFSIKQ